MKQIIHISSLFIILLATIACKEEKKPLTAQQIIDKTIENAGGEKYESAKVSFTFRNNQYISTNECGRFMLERIVTDSTNTKTHDMLNNEGLVRMTDGQPTKVADTLVVPISDAVNSVHYFAQLPYGLNAKAVNKKLVGEANIKDIDYYEIKVTFDQKGGGSDYQDIFMYWIDQKKFTIDYMAYSYEVNEGGVRFREAYNPRVVDGIRFVDYNNYKPESKYTDLQKLDSLFLQGNLKLLSKIETENLQVQLLDPDC